MPNDSHKMSLMIGYPAQKRGLESYFEMLLFLQSEIFLTFFQLLKLYRAFYCLLCNCTEVLLPTVHFHLLIDFPQLTSLLSFTLIYNLHPPNHHSTLHYYEMKCFRFYRSGNIWSLNLYPSPDGRMSQMTWFHFLYMKQEPILHVNSIFKNDLQMDAYVISNFS